MQRSILVLIAMFGLTTVGVTATTNTTVADVAAAGPLAIEPRVEMVEGQPWLILESSEAVLAMALKHRSKHKLDVVAFGRNVGAEPILYNPTQLRVTFIVNGTEVPGVAMTPDRWAKKQKKAAMWRSMAVGMANGLANSQRSTTTTYNGTNGYGTAVTKESRQDAQQRLIEKSAADGRRIAAQGEAAAANVAQIETLSPGELAGGAIHLEKAPKGASELVVELPLGSGVYVGRFPLAGGA